MTNEEAKWLNFLQSLDLTQIDNKTVAYLLQEVEQNNSSAIRDRIALVIEELGGDMEIDISPIVRAIEKFKHTNRIGTLIYVCSQFDCTKHFETFAKLATELSGEPFIGIITTIENMNGPIANDINLKVLNNLNQFRKLLSPEDYRTNYIERLISYLAGNNTPKKLPKPGTPPM